MKSAENTSPADEHAAFRRALGRFATGVTVVTTAVPGGHRAGITVSSFNSVSLEPPLVLWSIARDAFRYEAFAAAEHFAVNVLTVEQAALSEHFAAPGGNKFESLEFSDGLHGCPLLPGAAAHFECSTEHRYEGGDHLIIVGRVLRFEQRDAEPLIYCNGQYFTRGEPLS